MTACCRPGAETSGFVAGAELLGLVKRQRICAAVVACGKRLKHEGNVIADSSLFENAAGEPSSALVEDRQSARARVPLAERELVDVISGLASEQTGQIDRHRRQKVDCQSLRARGHPQGVILVRDADDEPSGSMLH